MKDPVEEGWFDALVEVARRVHLPAGGHLRRAGDVADAVDLLMSGRAECWSLGEDGREVWLGSCARGDVIGSTSLVPYDREPFDIVAETNVALLRLTRDEVERVADRHCGFALGLSSRLSRLLHDSRRLAVDAQTLSARRRIEAQLLRLCEPMEGEPGVGIVRPNPVFADMARRANTTRETVSRTVTSLCRKGVVERRPGALVIRGVEGLR